MSGNSRPRLRVQTAVVAAAVLVSPATRAADPTPSHGPRDRVESIELAANGSGGVIRTIPVYMHGTERTFRFAEGACRTYRISPDTLEALHAAMRTRQSIRITGPTVSTSDGETYECVDRVTFFPPEP